MINVEADFSDTLRHLDNVAQKQIPFAASQAINDTAVQSQKALVVQAQTKLDRPTPFTLKGFKVQRSSKRKLVAYVYIAPIQDKYLQFQIEGGTRRDKEVGRVLVPVNARLNKYGNIPGKRTGLTSGKKRFAAERNGVKGIWQRKGGKKNSRVELVAAYHDKASYSRVFPFHKIVGGVVSNNIARQFDKRLRLALRTAR